MTFLRKWIRNLLGFSGREANGFIILIPLLIVIIASEPVYRNYIASGERDYTGDRKKSDSLIALWQTAPTDTVGTHRNKQKTRERKLFGFDPNVATVDQFEALGFPAFLAKRVVSYRQKGGKFNTPDDLQRIYGMDTGLYNSIKKYVRIPQHRNEQTARQLEKPAIQSSKLRLDRFDINAADTITLKSVYGIGTKLAERIIRFRSGLGGFVSLNQLNEIYGLDSAVVNRLQERAFIAPDFTPRLININTTTEYDMAAHPYISKSQAKSIAAWRFQHGQFNSVDDIKNLGTLKAEDIVKIIPYLKVED